MGYVEQVRKLRPRVIQISSICEKLVKLLFSLRCVLYWSSARGQVLRWNLAQALPARRIPLRPWQVTSDM
jgi:hypothetical protein